MSPVCQRDGQGFMERFSVEKSSSVVMSQGDGLGVWELANEVCCIAATLRNFPADFFAYQFRIALRAEIRENLELEFQKLVAASFKAVEYMATFGGEMVKDARGAAAARGATSVERTVASAKGRETTKEKVGDKTEHLIMAMEKLHIALAQQVASQSRLHVPLRCHGCHGEGHIERFFPKKLEPVSHLLLSEEESDISLRELHVLGRVNKAMA